MVEGAWCGDTKINMNNLPGSRGLERPAEESRNLGQDFIRRLDPLERRCVFVVSVQKSADRLLQRVDRTACAALDLALGEQPEPSLDLACCCWDS